MPMGVLTLDWRLRKMEYIYMILNKENGKIYVGRTANPANRKRGHFSELRRGVHGNPKLQFAYNKYGKNAFVFDVIDCVQDGEGEQAEALWFERYDKNQRFMYNCHFETHSGPKCFGPMKQSVKQKISDRIKENTRPVAYKALQDMYDTSIGFKSASDKYNIASTTLLRYKEEFEQKHGVTLVHPQSEASKKRVSAFAADFKKDKKIALQNFRSYRVSRKSLEKYLPQHGIDPSEVRFDAWRIKAAQEADMAVHMALYTGCSAAQAIKACGATNTAYNRRLKEVKLERDLLSSTPA